MTTYALGDLAVLTFSVTDVSGNPTDATVALTVTAPDLTTQTPTPTHAGTGQYTATVTAGQVGAWTYLWSASGAVTMSDAGQFDVADPAPPLYASVATLRKRLNILDTSKDDLLFEALDTASREVEDDCGNRRFWLDPQPVARIFDPHQRTLWTPQGERLLVDDIGSTAVLTVEVGIESDENSWTPVPVFQTGPDNALAKREPIRYLLRPYLTWAFTPYQRVRITTQWGWPYIPPQIPTATLIKAARLYRRKDSPDGTLGSSDLGVIRVNKYDPDYDALIDRFIDRGGG